MTKKSFSVMIGLWLVDGCSTAKGNATSRTDALATQEDAGEQSGAEDGATPLDSVTIAAADGSIVNRSDGSPDEATVNAAFDGDWTGAAGLDLLIVFRVEAGVITLLDMGYAVEGSGCSLTGRSTTKGHLSIVDSKFTSSVPGATLSSTLSGSFSSSETAVGDLTLVSKAMPGQPVACVGSQSISWTGRKTVSGRSYDGTWSGQTAAGKDVSFVVADSSISSISFGYAMSAPESTCNVDSAYVGEPSSASIIGDQAILFETKGNLSFLGAVKFASATGANGNLRMSFRDPSVTPSCSGHSSLAFGASKQ